MIALPVKRLHEKPARVFEDLRINDENLIQFGRHQFHLFLKSKISRQDVGVQQQFHRPTTSRTDSSAAGATISPTILPVSLCAPIHALDFSAGGGGTPMAAGSPFSVTRIGSPF